MLPPLHDAIPFFPDVMKFSNFSNCGSWFGEMVEPHCQLSLICHLNSQCAIPYPLSASINDAHSWYLAAHTSFTASPDLKPLSSQHFL